MENDVDSYEIVEVGDIQVDDLLLSAEEHQAMLAQREAPYNWESESGQVSGTAEQKNGLRPVIGKLI